MIKFFQLNDIFFKLVNHQQQSKLSAQSCKFKAFLAKCAVYAFAYYFIHCYCAKLQYSIVESS